MPRERLVGRDFVESFLETGEATPEQIDELIQQRVPEDDQLEYKGGTWLSATAPPRRGHPTKPGRRLCKYICGFANSAGGVLLVGIDQLGDTDVPEKVNPQTCALWEPDAVKLRSKAATSLQGVAARHVVPLQIAVIPHSAGLVLAVGVVRAPDLIPQEEPGGAPLYYVRTFDGTSALSDHVAADLLVGRRARPTMSVRVRLDKGASGRDGMHLSLRLQVINDGPVWIDGLRVGVVFRAAAKHSKPVEAWLVREVEVVDPADLPYVTHVPADEVNYKWDALAPMAEVTCLANVVFPNSMGEYSMAAYVVARGHPPAWWEIQGEIVTANPGLYADKEAPPAEACRGARPRVHFTFRL